MKWFGKKTKDTITGFSGVAIGYCQYSTGCNQILIAPSTSKDGEFRESNWFDEQRVEFLPGKKVVINNGNTPGPDRVAPTK